MAKKNKSPFPKEMLITYEEPENARDEAYFMTYDHGIDQLDFNQNGKKVAVYKLAEVRTLKVNAYIVIPGRKELK
jgi:hypothetical protein